MNLLGRATNRMWDPFDRVWNHLIGLCDKISQDYYHERDEREDGFYLNPASWEDVLQRIQEADEAHMEKEEVDDTNEVLTMNILRGLLTSETMILDPTRTTSMLSTMIYTPPS